MKLFGAFVYVVTVQGLCVVFINMLYANTKSALC